MRARVRSFCRHTGRGAAGLAATVAFSLAAAMPASAHGPTPAAPPALDTLLLGWTFEPVPSLAIAVALIWWRWAVRRVNAAHPANPVPRRRSAAFVGGMAALAFALLSGIDAYDTALFSVHMVQHILLTLVAAPLIALSAPVTLVLRLASPATRQRWILPILHSRFVRVLAHPVVAWVAFAAVAWASHFSPLFDAALEDPVIHDLEHLLFLGSGLLFWWPVVALDPAPWRMSPPVRLLYVLTQMPQNTFLGVAILNATGVLYPHYATLDRPWGPTPIADQQLAAVIMWLVGDAIFLTAVALLLLAWMRTDERDADRSDRRAEVELRAIRERERSLAERRTRERPG